MKKFLFLMLLLPYGHISIAMENNQIVPSCPALAKGIAPNAYKGKVVLIDFWATWCPPCIKSIPFLNSLRNEQSASGFEVIAVNVDEEADAVHQFLQTHPVDYPIAYDPGGECPKAFDVKAMPSSYLIDKSGKVRNVFLGYRDEDQTSIRDSVKALLAE